ncbi:MAG TPA: chromosome segregation protein SMC, partial [Bacillota bacterium]|nr:chromosome segregation protein SMC [Bacillota bacterium]
IKDNIDKLQEERFDLINKAERVKGEQNLHKEKQSHMDRDNKRLLEEIGQERTEIANNEKEIAGLSLLLDEKNKMLDASNKEQESLLKEISLLDDDLTEKQESIDESKGSILNILNKISDSKESLTRYQTIKSNLDTRLHEILDLQLEKGKEDKTLSQEQVSLHNKIMSTKQKLKIEENKKETMEKLISDTKQTLVGMDSQIQVGKQEIEGMRSRHRLLEDMKKGYEGYYKSVRELLKACKRNNEIADKVCGELASLISVPKEYELAVETVLGSSLQHIVTDHENDAKYLIQYLKKKKLGRATFLPISSITSRQLNGKEKGVIAMKGCLGTANEYVKCDPKYKKIVDNLLGRVVVADDLESAIQMARSFSHSFRIVTIGGDVINPGGSMTGGSKAVKGISLLGRKRELIDLKRKIGDQDNKLNDLIDKQENLYQTHRKNKNTLDHLEGGIKEITLNLSKEEEALTSNLIRKEQIERDIEALNNEQNSIDQDLAEIDVLIIETKANLSKLEDENANINETAREWEASIKVLTNEREGLSSKVSDTRVKVATFTQETQALTGQSLRLKGEKSRHEEGIEKKAQQVEANKLEKARIEENNKDITSEIRQAMEQADSLQQQIHIERDKHTDGEKTLSELDQNIKNWNKSIEDLTRRRHQFEVSLSRMEAELENYQNNMWKEYEITYSNAVTHKDESLSYTKINQEIQRIKTDIAGLGEVNVNAVSEYNRVNDRYTFLTVQRDDLITAKDDLKIVIEDITHTMEKRFREEFAIINNHFGKTFRELFGGGTAQLVLEDEDDILSCGIEIIAQPPGKKLQSLLLLSGGERSLTAIAILFAILRHKPTPFCVLDEIDAALDESNVQQFGNFIKDLKDTTQFIIITHRKGTMEVSDVMYGIAMEEKGISKMISVKFEDMVS